MIGVLEFQCTIICVKSMVSMTLTRLQRITIQRVQYFTQSLGVLVLAALTHLIVHGRDQIYGLSLHQCLFKKQSKNVCQKKC